MRVSSQYNTLSSMNTTRYFSSQNGKQETIEVEVESQEEGHVNVEQEPVLSHTEQREFKAETRKLLDIVAKSIYTDK